MHVIIKPYNRFKDRLKYSKYFWFKSINKTIRELKEKAKI